MSIRMAQRVLYEAMKVAPPGHSFEEADAAMEKALEALDQKRYQDAILGAQKTRELIGR